LMVLLDTKVNEDLLVDLDNKDERVHVVVLVLAVLSVPKVLPEKREMLVKKVHLALQVKEDQLVFGVHQDSQGQKDLKVFPEKMVSQVILDNEENLVSKVKLVLKVLLVSSDHKELLVKLVPLENAGHLEQMVPLVKLVSQDPLDCPVVKEILVLPDLLA